MLNKANHQNARGILQGQSTREDKTTKLGCSERQCLLLIILPRVALKTPSLGLESAVIHSFQGGEYVCPKICLMQ